MIDKKNYYRVIFEWSGRPLKGFNVSDPMLLKDAKIFFNKVKQSGYNPELLKIEDNQE